MGVQEREQAPIGVFLTLAPPTKAMREAAVTAGLYETSHGRYRRVQILTIEDALSGARPDIPLVDTAGFGKARRARAEPAAQPALL